MKDKRGALTSRAHRSAFRSLIVGYGNSLRSDDGAGCKAAGALAEELSSPEISVVAVHQLTPELAESVAGARYVLFLDASPDGSPGEIRCEGILRDPCFQPQAMSHEFTPSSLLELAFRHFKAEPQAWLLSITGANFEIGEEFSKQVTAAWPSYLDRIRAWVRSS